MSRVAQLALIVCLFLIRPSAAETGQWEAGKQAFAARDYASALVYFQRAREGGLEGPAVHYNIAVVHFELEQYDEARESFELIVSRFPKMASLSEYNLGLVARRQGRRNDAAGHFLRAYELSADEKIRILSSQQIRELEPELRTVSRWSGAFGIRAGDDDNVALRDEAGVPVGTTTESPMVDLFASIIGPQTGRDGFRLSGSAYSIRFSDADEFDQSEFRLGGYYEWRRDDWRAQFGVRASASTLGGDSFDRKLGASARYMRYLGDNNVIELRYIYDDVSEGEDIFAGISGSRQQIDTRYRWYRDEHGIQLRYVYETNDRLDASVSPDRNRVTLNYRLQPLQGIGYEAGVEFRNSKFGEIVTPRDEDLVTFFGILHYSFANDWSVLLEYRQSDNDSNDSAFSYDRRQISFGAMKYF